MKKVLLATIILLHERTAGLSVAISGDIGDLETKVIGNQKTNLSNTTPLADFISGSNVGVGTVLPASTALYDVMRGSLSNSSNASAGVLQTKTATVDLHNSAGAYDLFTGTGQAVIVEKLVFQVPSVDVSDDTGGITGISVQTDDSEPAIFIPSADGVKANLTAEAQLSYTGAIAISVATKIQCTIIGGTADTDPTTCTVYAQYRAVVVGGYLA